MLTQAEKDVLSKGLNFAVTSNLIPTVDFITATEAAIKKNNMTGSEAADLRLRVTATLNSAKPPPSNITPEERKALTALQKDHSINILPADKGRCTVILNTTDYEAKINNLLEDTSTYQKLKRDPTSGYKKKVIDCLQKLEKEELIDRPMYYRLYPGDAIPCIYGLPKVHKQEVPLRPIVCSTDSITYNVAKYLKTILAPLVGNTEHHVENTQDFVEKVKHLLVDADDTIVSYVVVSLFTCIPTEEALAAVRRRLQEDNTLQERTKLTPSHICNLLDICLNTTYFKFRGNFYRQIHGCAMGSPVSPIVANLYMEEVEKKALTTFPGKPPSHWFRYVDDTFVKIKKQDLEAFTSHINAVDSNIKFTREDSKDNQLAFLDCSAIIGEDGKLQLEVYRKPTHTDQYLLFDSNHPLQHKLGVIRTLQHRAEEVPTSSEGKKKETQHVQKALSACGYPKWALNRAKRPKKQEKRETETEKRKNGVSIPYVSGLSEKLQRIFRQHDIPVFFKPVNTLRQKLVHPKDKMPTEKQSNVVYSIRCSEESCNEHYIGETKQPLHKRLYQHRREATSGPQSAVHLHLKATKHKFEDSEMTTLKTSTMDHSWMNEGLHRLVAKNFGEKTLKLIRDLENTIRKLADHRNHLRFNLRCRQSSIIPKSLQIKPPVKGRRAEKIWQKNLTLMLNERIRENNVSIKKFKNRAEFLEDKLSNIIPEEIGNRVKNFIQTAQLAQHSKSKERQIKKFNILLSRKRRDQERKEEKLGNSQKGAESIKNNWVRNLSDRMLTQAEKDVLSKGLNFAVTSNHIPTVDFITATEAAIKKNNMTGSEAADLRLRVTATLNSAKPPPSNITPEERKALTALQKDHSINILPADKGRCTVILNTTDYEAKINNLLEDTSTYQKLKRDPTSGYKKKVIDCLQKLEKEELIDRPMYYRLYPGDAIPCIYGLPKVHKQEVPLRPIVCSTDSITYNVAKYLKTILAPLVGNTEHHVENTQDFVEKVKHLLVDADDTIVSYDVVSLFTCIPTEEALAAVRQRLQEDNTLQERTKLTPSHICNLLDICLNTTYFKFRGNFYRQIHGCAMGSPVSPIVANLYMEEVEKKALTTFPGKPPSHWFRYVDDTFVKIKKQDLEAFTSHINAVDSNIKFTREDSKDNQLAFLDCSAIIGEDGKLQQKFTGNPLTQTNTFCLTPITHCSTN
ncbi:hypothetical protein WMY93_022492 [Mugilogobius chulae]|uniref:Reverse transcriptase domain-containing protein n=1 Tax=Mugilogobius chulae TaxID=88201 RepID=A0AAW0N747_9GOBI